MTETRRKGLSGFDMVLIGCGIGCAALILLAVLGVAFGSMWFFTPGEQVATDVIADDASLGVVRLHELAEDPGTQQLLTRVLERINEAGREQQREQLPPSLRWISDLQTQQSDPAAVNMLIPKEMTIAYELAEDGSSVDYVVAANPRTMVRMFKTMFNLISRGDDGGNVRAGRRRRADYRGHAAYTLEDKAHLSFVHSTVLFANSRRALERAIDRVAGDRVAGHSGGFDASTWIPRGEWDVEGAVGNEAGLVDGLLADLAQPEDFATDGGAPVDDEVLDDGPSEDGPDGENGLIAGEDLHLGFGFDVVSAHEVTGEMILECDDRQAAERWLLILERRYQTLRAEARKRGLELELTARTEGDRVVNDLRRLGLDDLIAEAFTAPEQPEEGEE